MKKSGFKSILTAMLTMIIAMVGINLLQQLGLKPVHIYIILGLVIAYLMIPVIMFMVDTKFRKEYTVIFEKYEGDAKENGLEHESLALDMIQSIENIEAKPKSILSKNTYNTALAQLYLVSHDYKQAREYCDKITKVLPGTGFGLNRQIMNLKAKVYSEIEKAEALKDNVLNPVVVDDIEIVTPPETIEVVVVEEVVEVEEVREDNQEN
ncbi:MAG: hypothetical protein RR565_04595 [Erysipelothrix sp.]